MTRLTLANGKNVEVSQEEVSGFITQVLLPNPDWRHAWDEVWAKFVASMKDKEEAVTVQSSGHRGGIGTRADCAGGRAGENKPS